MSSFKCLLFCSITLILSHISLAANPVGAAYRGSQTSPNTQQTLEKYSAHSQAFCKNDDDCPTVRCLMCANLCIQNKCTMVQCEDHGEYDFEQFKCVCKPGYTGRFCEKKISGTSGFCREEMDCPQPKCIDCRTLCINNKCTPVRCDKHGHYDLSKHKCICNPGYTGRFCEQKITR